MSGLFSHAAGPGQDADEKPDIFAAAAVPASRDHAWAGLTEHVHLWWPAGSLSRWGAESFFDLEDNALVETSQQDDENVWGVVVDGRPGEWLALTWRHAGSASATGLRLEVRTASEVVTDADDDAASRVATRDASPDGESSVLLVTHGGWTGADPGDLYDFYRGFWPEALGCYRRFMGGT